MPGIIGFQEFHPSANAANRLNDMAFALRVRSTDVVSIQSTEHINLGSVRLGTFSNTSQPAWNADRSIGVVVAGEIFWDAQQKAALCQCGYSLDDDNAASLIVHLYQEQGENFICSLNGAFAIAIWDDSRQKLLLANDRLGYEPLYYAQTPERFAFASGMRSLLVDPLLPRAVNLLAFAQLLTFDHVLGNHTFLQDVHLLPPGSILTLSNGQVGIRTYWQLEFPEYYAVRCEKDYQEELISLLRQAMARQKPEGPAGIMLSGGLDSRVVLALLCEKPLATQLRAFTFGNPGCDDLRYAKELAKKSHIPHQSYPLRPDYLIQQAEAGIRLTDGMENVVHMHTLDNLAAQVAQAPIIYKGFLGDALTGYFSYRDLLAHFPTADITNAFFERYPIVFKPSVHAQLFTPDVMNQLPGDMVLQTARSELTLLGEKHLAADQFFQFDLRQRQRRLTLNGVRLVRSQAIVRTPFYDNDLLDFMLRVPQGYRLERYLITQTFIAAFPDLAKVPSTADGYPMMPCFRDLFMHLNERIRWRLRSAGVKIAVPQKRHYASYNKWFRGALRPWAEDILNSKRFRERGYFNPVYVGQLLDEHMAGKNHYQKLGALISIELWHRQFLD